MPIDIPHLEQHFGLVAMREMELEALVQYANRMDLTAHVAAARSLRLEAPSDPTYAVDANGVATVELLGAMTKYGSSLTGNAGTVALRRTLRTAAADDQVTGIMLVVDSPGGMVTGTDDLAADVRRLAAQIPVATYIEDVGASAAYYVASQAGTVIVNPSAAVGSIGVFMAVYDYSQAATDEGIKAQVIRFGRYKGAGVMGTEITDEQLAEWQRNIDSYGRLFVEAIATGRGMTVAQATDLADGRIHVGGEAVTLGLADATGTREDVAALLAGGRVPLRTNVQQPSGLMVNIPKQEIEPMAENKNQAPEDKAPEPQTIKPKVAQPVAVTLRELKAEFPDMSAEWREGCMEAGVTLAEAKDRYIGALKQQTADARKQAEEVKTAAEAASNAPGVAPLGNGTTKAGAGATGTAVDRWNAAVAEKVEAGVKQRDAIRALTTDDPELHAEYLREYTATNTRKTA